MRDKNGRFTKSENEGFFIDLRFITIKRVIAWALVFTILLPWLTIISKFNLIQKIFDFIERLLEGPKKEDLETSKKNGLFY